MTLTSKEYFLKNVNIGDKITYEDNINNYLYINNYLSFGGIINDIQENNLSINLFTKELIFYVDFQNKQIHGIHKETNLSYEVTQIRELNVSIFFLDENNLQPNDDKFSVENFMNENSEIKSILDKVDNFKGIAINLQETEVIDKPSRYNGDHCQQIIEQWPIKKANGNSAGFSWCIGNILKYLYRIEEKGDPIQQIDKAIWYLNRIKSYYQNEGK